MEKFPGVYEYEGLKGEDNFYNNLKLIQENISDKTKLYILSGIELGYIGNTFETHNKRHVIHRRYNKVLEKISRQYDNVQILDVNKFVRNQNDFTNCINHWSREVYFQMANEMKNILYKNGVDVTLKRRSKIKDKLRSLLDKFK